MLNQSHEKIKIIAKIQKSIDQLGKIIRADLYNFTLINIC